MGRLVNPGKKNYTGAGGEIYPESMSGRVKSNFLIQLQNKGRNQPGGKGKKDRYSLLSNKALQIVSLYKRNDAIAGIAGNAAVPTLGHLFTTQELLGYKNSKTTGIYTHDSLCHSGDIGTLLDSL